jgi:ABC-2 type transport system ATP-binding protein
MAGVIKAEGVEKNFKGVKALAGFDLEVPAGTICGLLGPNGAGKTTAVRILTTLLGFDAGRASVAGIDVSTEAKKVKQHIGLVGQHAALDEILGARQNLVMFGRLYHLGARSARRRADELLEQFGLADVGTRPVKSFSGGMRRRLDLAASLILAPPVLFLDEPTTGLDPRGRNEVWQAIRALARQGATVLLTTQYLEEADQLADQITVIDAGRVIACGAPDELKGAGRLEVVVRRDVEKAAQIVAAQSIDPESRRITAVAGDVLGQITALQTNGIEIEEFGLRRPTLDEVFLSLTGKEKS